MVKLFCVIVGVAGSAFSVDIDESESVDHLKDAIKKENSNDWKDVDADKLQLFLAKKGNAWLTEADVENGVSDTSGLKPLDVVGAPLNLVDLSKEDVRFQVTKQDVQAKRIPVHVLVVVPSGKNITIEEASDVAFTRELEYYQERGRRIQSHRHDYCKAILNKVDDYYGLEMRPLPFICVEGSSGMGKSQLAFALGGGRRSWFYWPVTNIGLCSQTIYKNFRSISIAFRQVTDLDEPTSKSETDILDSMSSVYETDRLWTYGLICELLKHSSMDDYQHPQMIRFTERKTLRVRQCSLDDVKEVCSEITAAGKLLPFFVLDEMSFNTNQDAGGKETAAFQRNVFRACGLVVVVMGTDAKISTLASRSEGSNKQDRKWMSIVSRFPPYEFVPFGDLEKQEAWESIVAQYPVVNAIAVGSRGRFSRYFVDSVVAYATTKSSPNLCDLLDDAFHQVAYRTQCGKKFMSKWTGQEAQLMAISYSNAAIQLLDGNTNDNATDTTSEPPSKRRKTDAGVTYMHVHFANLVDDQLTDVDLSNGTLKANHNSWQPSCCFPSIEEDLLLYLAVLGGKQYSGYYDHDMGKAHSTRDIFSMHRKRNGFLVHGNENAVKNDYLSYENMVAHMIYCASRRDGVRGICFDDFFAWLLSEFQDGSQPLKMVVGDAEVSASQFFVGFDALAGLLETKIPFLAPPKAKWPQCILDTCDRRDGCNFGHLVRAADNERCDVYVQDGRRTSGTTGTSASDAPKATSATDNTTEVVARTPLFLCECKHRKAAVGIGVIRGTIEGLESKWAGKWKVVLVFCDRVTALQGWEYPEIGCATIDCCTRVAKWVFRPLEKGNEKKLVVVMSTGS